MAKFKYLGPDNALVGRFGRLNSGDVIKMWQSETECLLARPNPCWELIEEEDDLVGVGTVLPIRTRWYDLTRIYWLKEALSSLKRLSRPDLLSVVRAMRDIGAHVVDEKAAQTMSREALIEEAYGEVKRLKWDQPGYGAIDHNARPEPTEPVAVITKQEPTEQTEQTETTGEPEAKEEAPVVTDEPDEPVIVEAEKEVVAEKPAKTAKADNKKPAEDKSYRSIRREKK